MDEHQISKIPAPDLPPEVLSEIESYFQWELVLNPKDMVEIMEAYARLESLAISEADPAESELIEWEDLFEFVPIVGNPTYDIETLEIQSPDDLEVETWLEFIKAQIGLDEDEEAESMLTEDQYQELLDFQTKPSVSVAENHPWLKDIPEVVNKAQVIETARQRQHAKTMVEHLKKPICLVCSPVELPIYLHNAFKVNGKLQCWMFLGHDYFGSSPDEWDDVSLLLFSAVFVDVKPDQKPTLIAVVAGHYLVPYKDGNLMDPESFMCIMDSHSAYLNDVWKAVTGRFLPKQKWSLDDFHEACGGAGGAGIAAITITVQPEYRGLKLSRFLLDVLRNMTVSADLYDYFSQAEIDEFNDYELKADCLAHTPIGLFVLAIEGTQPDPEGTFILPHLAYDPETTTKPAKVLDAQIERRRLKLTKYFNAVGEQAKDYYILTYNPWDYPLT